MSIQNFLHLRGVEMFSRTGVPLHVFRLSGCESLRHSHDFHELFLVTKGTSHHQLYSPGGELHEALELGPGHLMSVPLGWSHAYQPSEDFEIFNVAFAPQMLENWPRITERFRLFSHSPEVPTAWSLRRAGLEQLETQLQNVARELVERSVGYEYAAPAKLLDILVWIERLDLETKQKIKPELVAMVSQTIVFMEQHLATSIRLEDMANIVHLNETYFCEVFKQVTGISPGRYLMRLRLEHARYLLLSTVQPVTTVARESGFTDPSHFARAFKGAFGTSPTRLRHTREQS
ncbi:AraC family transcriptional regulator [bacterium]|nr:MAG: AraC family transcriptional regulator [bacterium]